jgi:hypothetical protein
VRNGGDDADREVAGGELLRWTVHPVRRRHGRTAALAGIGIATLAAVWLGTGSGPWVLFAGIVVLGSARQFLLPTTYVLDDAGVTLRFLGGTRRRAWTEVRSCVRDGSGVLLSPFPRKSPLESFRGLFLIFDGNADEVMAIVKARMGREARRGPDA